METRGEKASKNSTAVMPRKINLHYTPRDGLSDRVRREKELLFSAPAHLDIQKLLIETEVYRDWACSKGFSWIKATIFDRLSREKNVWVDGNPICGHLTNYVYGGYIQPWRDSAWIEGAKEFALQRGSYKTTPEEQKQIAECGEFWLGKNMQDRVRPIIKEKYGLDVQKLVDITMRSARAVRNIRVCRNATSSPLKRWAHRCPSRS